MRPGALAILAVAILPAAAAGQGGEWPTLTGLGLEYISRSGGVQIGLSGQLDVEAIYVSNSWASLVSMEGGTDVLVSTAEDCTICHADEPLGSGSGGLGAHRLRLFADIFLGDHVYSLVELRADRGESPTNGKGRARVEQAYVRVSSTAGTSGVQVGLFASPFGSYPLRHLTVVDPFVRPPLAYDYRTLMNRTVVPGSVEGLLDWRHTPESFRRPGAPPVWDVPYQWGAMAFGRLLGMDLRVAAMNSAPSSAPDAWRFDVDRLRRPSWVVAARTRPSRDLEVGVSWSRGPWMEPFTSGVDSSAAVPDYRDFDQELLSGDVTFARGATVLRAEAILDRWAVPNIARRPTEVLYNVEVQRDLSAGVFAAVRLGHIDFRPLRGGDESTRGIDWDRDVTRYEASVGYRLVRNAGVILSASEQVQRGASDADGRFFGLRWWWAF